ncbi:MULTISPECIES: type I-E CRISPR-associated protein Cse2/CasB [Photorhabdus]|uniref:type I-E CRISPR-associated protein Cse2/CasB n=1 Tax=Photorhabdus TaxID=29487 RepID=UPI000DCDE510|nr:MULTISPECIES: type I-E CRISPR-associated protein Cse2/CasB [Photorhabdus]MCT8342913.1 type I-E CRISPR-associated protein Cse2/CasB [Photorhabdus kleinii]RAX00340.1 type I-E CRISPR-associated protein Cse2/CasB [Photorhabdus sp. S9-53]RAX00532.1 type I-E CRISPR-associated protein Cse2/CasB [Photorhabdus sp. S10-54]RAX04841.1 type I-E CRISPR-associated protein Cse2/CasB [Photorhabdus sp. S8-52]
MDSKSEIILLHWWQSMFMSPKQLKEKGIIPAPSTYRAQLKRCESVEMAMLTEGFRALWLSLPDEISLSDNPAKLEYWATMAVALVYVKNNSDIKLAVAAGKKGGGNKPVVSELRFSQLQNAKTPNELLRRLRRVLQQIKGNISVLALARDIEEWFAEYGQLQPCKADRRIKVRWVMDYYRAASGKSVDLSDFY